MIVDWSYSVLRRIAIFRPYNGGIFWSYSDYACNEMFKHVHTKRINIIVKDIFFWKEIWVIKCQLQIYLHFLIAFKK